MADTLIVNDAHPNWKSLPVEISHKIFLLVWWSTGRTKGYCEVTLVCKSWTHPAQAVLFTDVTVRSFLHLKRLQDAINHRPALGKNVKTFMCDVYDGEKTKKEDILTSLLSTHLPNVERFSSSQRISYLPIVNALLNNRLIHLKNLENPNIYATESDVTNYSTCALLMKDRIKELQICDTFNAIKDPKQAKSLFNLLYNNLHQFDKLSTLSIKNDTNDVIKDLEYITSACKTLEELSFNFSSLKNLNHVSPTAFRAFDTISEFVPELSIKSIKGYVKTADFYKVFSYVIHKFPQLQKFSLSVNTKDPAITDNQTITLLQKNMSKFNDCSVSIKVNNDTVWDIIGGAWVETSKLGSEHLEIDYSEEREQCELAIQKRKKKENPTVTRVYPSYDDGWVHNSFIENYGIYLSSLEFSFSPENSTFYEADLRELPGNFLGHLVVHCPHLKCLTISNFMLRRSPYVNFDLSKKLSLSLLCIKYCSFYAGALEQLSFSLPKLKKLQLGFFINYCRKDEDITTDEPTDEALEIIMPHTTIDCIEFEHPGQEPFYLKFYSLSEQKYYRYRCDFEDGFDDDNYKSVISEEEYSVTNYEKHYYICSQTLPQFYFT